MTQQEEERNQWIHTHILRQPLYCQGTLQELSSSDLRIRSYGCRKCHQVAHVSRYELEYAPIQNIIGPYGHKLPVSNYTRDPSLLMQLLTHIGERDQHEGLLYHLLCRMGIAQEDIPLSPDVLKTVFQMEMMGSIPTQTVNKIYEASQDMQKADWKDFPDGTHYLLDRLSRRWNRNAVPLFARIGGPVYTLHAWDLPYAFCYPSIHFWDQTDVLAWEREPWDSFPPLHINEFGETLKKEFREVYGPDSWTGDGMHYYWRFHVRF